MSLFEAGLSAIQAFKENGRPPVSASELEVETRSPVQAHCHSEEDSGVARGRSKKPQGGDDEGEVEGAALTCLPLLASRVCPFQRKA